MVFCGLPENEAQLEPVAKEFRKAGPLGSSIATAMNLVRNRRDFANKKSDVE